ncbi:MAG TPA: helix-turn-helix domain-containing protein [Ktedonobacteraceae bacterium]|jgi:excisionase family DNA binding protein
MDNPYLTTKQVAELLQVTEETVIGYIRRKRDPLPATRPGKSYLILRTELDEWLKRQRPEKN